MRHLACLELVDETFSARHLLSLLPLEQELLVQCHPQRRRQQRRQGSAGQYVLQHLEDVPSALPMDILRLSVAAALIE